MNPEFIQKITNSNSNIILKLNPKFENLPLPITWFDDPFFPFGKQVISATQDIVAGYLFDFASYLAMGGAGVVALERTLGFVPRDKVKILHAPFTGQGFSAMADANEFNLDAITVTNHTDLEYYCNNVPYTAFLATTQNETVPNRGGIYQAINNTIEYKSADTVHQLLVTTDDVLYSSKLDNFTDKIREGIQALT